MKQIITLRRRSRRHADSHLEMGLAMHAAWAGLRVGLLLVACGLGSAQAALNVVATTPDLAALVADIGGDRVVLTTLARPTEDPHFLDPKPSFVAKLNRADALVEGGAELEAAWLGPLLEGARNPRLAAGSVGRIACASGVSMLEVPAVLDRAQGDIHATGNPHYLTDPENARVVAAHLCEAFGKLDAAGAAGFRANLDRFNRTLDGKMSEWKRALAPFRGRRLVAYHNIWPYFAKRFELRVDLFLEPKPGIPPTPAHLAEVIREMKADAVRVIIVEPFQGRKTAQAVAAQTGAHVVDLTQYPGGVKGTEGGYFQLLDHIVKTLAGTLGEKG